MSSFTSYGGPSQEITPSTKPFLGYPNAVWRISEHALLVAESPELRRLSNPFSRQIACHFVLVIAVCQGKNSMKHTFSADKDAPKVCLIKSDQNIAIMVQITSKQVRGERTANIEGKPRGVLDTERLHPRPECRDIFRKNRLKEQNNSEFLRIRS